MRDFEKESAFNKIYDSTNKQILAFITAKCCNIEDINDIFQESYTELFLTINRRGENYINNPEAFMKKIAKQKIYRFYSARERLKMQISANQVDKDDKEYDLTDFCDNKVLIEDDYLIKEQIDEVKEFLENKDLTTRKIFYLFYSIEKQIPEISELLGISQSNVKNRIYRTLKEIKIEFKLKEGVKK